MDSALQRCMYGEFFFIVFFFSYFRTSICLQVITEVGHLSIRRTRQGHIPSGGRDTRFSRWGPACRQQLSRRADASGPKSATSATWACYRTSRMRLVRMRAANPVGTHRALARSLILPASALLSPLCSFSAPAQTLHSQILFLRF
jgi:hypothetical protein